MIQPHTGMDALMMMGVIHSRCWLEAVSVEAMEHPSSFRSILSSISTDIPDVETDPKLFDRDRVAIADPFRDRNPVQGTPILVATDPKPVGLVQKPL